MKGSDVVKVLGTASILIVIICCAVLIREGRSKVEGGDKNHSDDPSNMPSQETLKIRLNKGQTPFEGVVSEMEQMMESVPGLNDKQFENFNDWLVDDPYVSNPVNIMRDPSVIIHAGGSITPHQKTNSLISECSEIGARLVSLGLRSPKYRDVDFRRIMGSGCVVRGRCQLLPETRCSTNMVQSDSHIFVGYDGHENAERMSDAICSKIETIQMGGEEIDVDAEIFIAINSKDKEEEERIYFQYMGH